VGAGQLCEYAQRHDNGRGDESAGRLKALGRAPKCSQGRVPQHRFLPVHSAVALILKRRMISDGSADWKIRLGL
jgi:hypothetical protein